MPEDRSTPAERFVQRSRIDETGMGEPLTRRALERQRSVEEYLKGQELPRWIRRAREIEKATAQHERRLAEAQAVLGQQYADDPAGFRAAWLALAETWSFDDVNEVIRAHNAYYPIERDLPMDPRTGEYIQLGGRRFERPELDRDWLLARFPATP